MLKLPEGYALRPAVWADLEAVTDLIATVSAAEDAGGHSLEEQRAAWERPNFNVATEAWVITHATGLAAYGEVWERRKHEVYMLDGYVHLTHRGQGVGAAILQQMETHARTRFADSAPGAQARMLHWTSAHDQAAPGLFAQQGFQQARQAWHMRIDMTAPPPAPTWPTNIAPRPYQGLAEAQAAHAVVQEAFSDLEDFVPTPFEDWQKMMLRPEEFDPALWVLAFAGETLAGVALSCQYDDEGWIKQVAVRRAYRHLGLGLALLQQAFGAFYQRGVRRVELGVDAANATGATRLYQRAGMSAARHFISYEKLLRQGAAQPG